MKPFISIRTHALLVLAIVAALLDLLMQRCLGGVVSIAWATRPAFMPQHPGFAEFHQKVTAEQGPMAIVWQPLYDYVLYPTAGQTNLAFFATQNGQGLSSSSGNATNVKALTDTNMTDNGKLSVPSAFFIHSVEVDFQPGSVNTANTFTIQIPAASANQAATVQAGSADSNAVYTGGALELKIGNDVQFQEGPLYMFPPRAHLRLDAALGSDSDGAALAVKEKMFVEGAVNTMNPGLGIAPGRPFAVNLIWPAVIATPSGFNGRIGVRLNGWMLKGLPS